MHIAHLVREDRACCVHAAAIHLYLAEQAFQFCLRVSLLSREPSVFDRTFEGQFGTFEILLQLLEEAIDLFGSWKCMLALFPSLERLVYRPPLDTGTGPCGLIAIISSRLLMALMQDVEQEGRDICVRQPCVEYDLNRRRRRRNEVSGF